MTFPVLFDLEKTEQDLLKRFNSDVVEKVSLLKEIWKKTTINGGNISLDILYISKAENIIINDTYKNKMQQLRDCVEKIFKAKNINIGNVSCSELLKSYTTHKINRLSIEFKDQPLSTNYKNTDIGYIGMVKLYTYKKFITSEDNMIRDDLFESNIRHFQGDVDVNKKIKDSINNNNKEDFWWLNNGITIIAESPTQIGKILSLENIQIVNGLQTSYSIYNNYNGNENDERSVLVKVIINNNKETIDNIIESTNSQNPVSATLLRATETIQRNIELYYLNKGYFYDRRKNYYKNQGKPSSKIFGIQYTAQAIKTILFNEPHTARAKPTSLMKEDKIYNQIFNKNNNLKIFLVCCLINKKSNDYWSKIDKIDDKDKLINLKLHLSWIYSKFVFNKYNVTLDDLINIDLNLFNKKTFNDSVTFLIASINEYLKINESSNLINMAKTSEFTKFLANRIQSLFK